MFKLHYVCIFLFQVVSSITSGVVVLMFCCEIKVGVVALCSRLACRGDSTDSENQRVKFAKTTLSQNFKTYNMSHSHSLINLCILPSSVVFFNWLVENTVDRATPSTSFAIAFRPMQLVVSPYGELSTPNRRLVCI